MGFPVGKKGPKKRNGSFKNKAKLLPAPAAKPEPPRDQNTKGKAKAVIEPVPEEDWSEPPTEDEDEDDVATYDPSKEARPLAGKVLTISGVVEDRQSILDMAEELGAEAGPSYRRGTTHLLCGRAQLFGDKYFAAIWTEAKVMDPAWIQAVRQAWMTGERVDYDEIERNHRLKALYGIAVCLTDFALGEHREKVRQHIVKSGGIVRTSLQTDGPDPVRYLIIASPESPHSQMRPPDKYHYAIKHGIQVVWEKWIYSTIEAQGRLPCCDAYWTYRPGQPEPSPLDYVKEPPKAFKAGDHVKRSHSNVMLGDTSSKVASKDDDELVMMSKRNKAKASKDADATDSLLAQYQRPLNRSTTATIQLGEQANRDSTDLRPSRSEAVVVASTSTDKPRLRSLGSSRSTSFQPASPAKPKRIVAPSVIAEQSQEDDEDNSSSAEHFLRDVTLFFSDEFKLEIRTKLRQAVEEVGATVTTDPKDLALVDHIVVPSNKGDDSWLDPSFAHFDKVVTPNYLERCMEARAVAKAGDSWFDRPWPFRKGVPGWATEKIYVTGAAQGSPVKQHMLRLIKHVGATMQEDMQDFTLFVDCSASRDDMTPEESLRLESRKAAAKQRGARCMSVDELIEAILKDAKKAGLMRVARLNDVADLDGDLTMSAPAPTNRTSRKRKLAEGPAASLAPSQPSARLFDHLVFFCDSSVKDATRIKGLIQTSGGALSPSIGRAVTHYVTAGDNKRALTKALKSFEPHVVHPRWVEACIEARRLVSEREYPREWDAKKGAQLSSMITSPPRRPGSPSPPARSSSAAALSARPSQTKTQPKPASQKRAPSPQPNPAEPVRDGSAPPTGSSEADALPPVQQPPSNRPSSPPVPSSPASRHDDPVNTSPPSSSRQGAAAAAADEQQSDLVAFISAQAAELEQYAVPTGAVAANKAMARKRSKISRKRSLADTSNGTAAADKQEDDSAIDLHQNGANDSSMGRGGGAPARPQGFGFEGSQMSQFNEEESLQIRYADPVGRKEGEAIMALLMKKQKEQESKGGAGLETVGEAQGQDDTVSKSKKRRL